ncbi:hypothetical protein KBC55_03220 [Patescibacteria group bacterium]|nr:hypothetical protein [Patescibacteria group bacterium]
MLSRDDIKYRLDLWERVEKSIRQFFVDQKYREVRTPLLVASPGMEPNLDPVAVEIKKITAGRGIESHRGGLITSPEYAMKKLLGAGLEKIFTITPVFRNIEKLGERWSIEFTMLEWYEQGADYNHGMKQTGELVDAILGAKPWSRVSYVDEFTNTFSAHPDSIEIAKLHELGSKYHVSMEPGELRHELVDRLFASIVMPLLEKQHDRFFLCEYPVCCASLAKVGGDGHFAERFEAYVQGLEICNGFTELTDGKEQRKRFELEAIERKNAGKEVFPIDEELLTRLSSVQNPTFGNALGVDRLVMLLAGVNDIDAIHPFPPSQRF